MITLRLFDGYDHTSPDSRPAVRELQEALNKAGHRTTVDGYFGPATMAAVEAFQSQKGLPVDGIATAPTWAALLVGPRIDLAFFDTTYLAHAFTGHLNESDQYREYIARASEISGYAVPIVWAIGSRESGWGLALRPQGPGGTGDFAPRSGGKPHDGGGYGRGLMQIDYKSHEFARTGPWSNPRENILYAASVMLDNIRWQVKNWPALSKTQALRASIAAYNCGPGNVSRALKSGRDIDYFTSHRDYSADVLNRAGWFQRHGWK